MNATVRGTAGRSDVHVGLQGVEDMRLAGIEAASAISHRPGASGASPALLLFGQCAKLFREMYEDGVPAAAHPEADDPSTALARRFRIRLACKQALARYHARDLLRRSVSARARPVKEVEMPTFCLLPTVYYAGRNQEPVCKGLLCWSRHCDRDAE